MASNRTRNTVINTTTAIVSQAVTALLAFFSRTALVRTLGIQAVSLNGLFGEIITMLSLAELGVGSAIIYHLYKPLAENDEKRVCQLMSLYQSAYRIIALAIFSIGLLLTPFLQYLVNSVSYPMSYVRLVYVLFVIQSASSYLFAYKSALLTADQKRYVVVIITLIVKTLSVIAVVAVLFLTGNYIAYLCVTILFTLATNVACAIYADRHYPYLCSDGSMGREEKKQIFKNIKYLFVGNLSVKLISSTDNILISTLVSTLQVGYYSNYSIFFNILKQLRMQLASGISGSLGNLMVSETKEHSVRVLNRLSYLFYVLGFVLSLGIFACVTPVIQLWLGEDYLLPGAVVSVSCLNLFIDYCKPPLWQMVAVSGRFRENRNISLTACVVNLTVSIVLGWKLGMIGIFLGTTVTCLVEIAQKTRLIFGKVFRASARAYAARWCYYLLSFLAAQAGIVWFTSAVRLENLFVQVLANGVAAVILSIPFCVLVFLKQEDFRFAVDLVRRCLLLGKRRKGSERNG